jgi:hypothetical protein
MGMKRKVVGNTFTRYVAARLGELRDEYFQMLSYVGVETVNYIWNRSGEESWYDQTGNLRSSIGFVIAEDGKVVHEGGFDTVLDGAEGSEKGRAFARSLPDLVEGFRKGMVLIVVAGMEYAAYVEAMENKDVLASSKLYANRVMRELLDKMNKR